MKTEEQLKEEIKQEAKNRANSFYTGEAEFHTIWMNRANDFKTGALSLSSKAYWQNGMIPIEDIQLIKDNFKKLVDIALLDIDLDYLEYREGYLRAMTNVIAIVDELVDKHKMK